MIPWCYYIGTNSPILAALHTWKFPPPQRVQQLLPINQKCFLPSRSQIVAYTRETNQRNSRESKPTSSLLGRGGSSQGSVLVDDLLPFISFSPNEYQPPNAWQSQPQPSWCGDTIMRKLHSQMNFKYSSQQLNLQMSVFSLSIAGSPSVQRQIAANTKFASRKHKLFISGV